MISYGYSEKGQQGNIGDVMLWRRILRYCKEHMVFICFAILLSLAISGATLALPKLVQYAIDSYMAPVSAPPMDIRLAGLQKVALWYGCLIIALFGAGFLQVVLLEWVGQSIMDTLRQQLFAHVLTLDMWFFHEQKVGRLVTRLTNDIQNMYEMFTSVMVTMCNDLFKLVGIFCVLFYMNAYLALWLTLFIPLACIVTSFFAKIARERFRRIRTQLARLNGFLAETLEAMTIIQVFNRQKISGEKYCQQTQEYLDRNLDQIKVFAFFMPLADLMSASSVACILWYGGGEHLQGRLTLGELVAFLAYMRLFFQPLRELAQKYSIVQSAMASAERIFQLLDTQPRLVVSEQAVEPGSTAGALCFDHVHFSYDGQEKVLRDIHLDIAAGETVALVGSTGAGKTTLIHLLARFYDPDSGRVTIDGIDVRTFTLDSLRSQVAVIMQDIYLLPDTVRANIILDGEYNEQRLTTILQDTALQSFIDKLPKGLDTVIGEDVKALSVGEKQLLSFVRSMYRDPAILVLDEATSSIDVESERLLERAVAEGFKGRTSIIIAHRLSTIRRADRIIVLDQGKIIEQGSHEELMARKSRYKTFVELDILGEPCQE
ncbi:MAG: ABC transporter ATP-binding protein [Desulfobulbus propionicus]|nr:MAG: ABC transporter ATP-binding protein [Desulfobulbus propionicus]